MIGKDPLFNCQTEGGIQFQITPLVTGQKFKITSIVFFLMLATTEFIPLVNFAKKEPKKVNYEIPRKVSNAVSKADLSLTCLWDDCRDQEGQNQSDMKVFMQHVKKHAFSVTQEVLNNPHNQLILGYILKHFLSPLRATFAIGKVVNLKSTWNRISLATSISMHFTPKSKITGPKSSIMLNYSLVN